jgi:hypothetical protein
MLRGFPTKKEKDVDKNGLIIAKAKALIKEACQCEKVSCSSEGCTLYALTLILDGEPWCQCSECYEYWEPKLENGYFPELGDEPDIMGIDTGPHVCPECEKELDD